MLRYSDAPAALPALAEEHHVDGFEHRAPIQKQGKIANIIEVEAQLLDGVVEVLAIRIIDLRPAGDAGPDQVTEVMHELLATLVTNAPPRDREVEAAKAKARSEERFGASGRG